MMEALSPDRLEVWKDCEIYQFDEMMRTEGIKTRVRAIPNWEYRRKLRKLIHTS